MSARGRSSVTLDAMITISDRRLFVVALSVSVGITAVHLVAMVIVFARDGDPTRDLAGLVNVGLDSAAPTWFAAAVLALCAALALAIRARTTTDDPTGRWPWLALAVLLLVMSIDEVATAHERLNSVGEVVVDRDGVFFYSWVVVGSFAVLLAAVVFGPFLFRLDSRTRRLFVIAGVIFVSGALVIEAFNGALHASDGETGDETLRFWLQTGIEELFEMVGVCVLLYALASRLTDDDGVLEFGIVPAGSVHDVRAGDTASGDRPPDHRSPDDHPNRADRRRR